MEIFFEAAATAAAAWMVLAYDFAYVSLTADPIELVNSTARTWVEDAISNARFAVFANVSSESNESGE